MAGAGCWRSRLLEIRTRRDPGTGRTQRVGQEHPAAPAELSGAPQQRRDRIRGQALRQRAGDAARAAPAGDHRLPAPDAIEPQRLGQCQLWFGAARQARITGQPSRQPWKRSVWRSWHANAPAPYRAARRNGSRWRAPWCCNRMCCCWMSQPPTWTPIMSA